MTSTEVATRILLTVIIVGALSINHCGASTTTNTPVSAPSGGQTLTLLKVPLKSSSGGDQSNLTLNSVTFHKSAPPISATTSQSNLSDSIDEDDATVRLLPDSAEAGILLPFDDDFPVPGGGSRRFPEHHDPTGLPSSVSFPARPIPLRIDSGKALYSPSFGKQDDKSTYFLNNNCFGPRCPLQRRIGDSESGGSDAWKNIRYRGKESKGKRYDDGMPNRLDNGLDGMSTTMHSQVAIPFVVVDDSVGKGQSSYSKRSGTAFNGPMSMITSPGQTVTTEGWVKLKAISPDIYDPFRFAKNESLRGSDMKQSTFSKRDSSSNKNNNFSKRLGVELNPESFADRWGWSASNEDGNNQQRVGGSRLPAWLEEQLKYGNRKSEHGKNWVKLEPIPVAGVSISKWVPKGTPSHELPTTILQPNRDRPNGGNPWWDRLDDTRILSGNRPSQLRPGGHGHSGDRRYGSSGGGWDSKGSSLSAFDRYPTNSWNDIIYPEGPTSATVSWQQNKGMSNYPSSFTVSGGGGSGGWSSGNDNPRKSIVATGSWSAPPSSNPRFPSFINRFTDHRPNSYPSKHMSEDDPRWVLISNTRRVAQSASSHNGHDLLDRSKVLSYINRLHPDMDRRTDFPFYDSTSHNSHRHGKDFWPWPTTGSIPPKPFYPNYPSKDEAFQRVNATLSTLTPVLVHRSGTTLRPAPILNTLRPSSFSVDDVEVGSGGASSDDFLLSSTSRPMTLLSTFIGGARASTISDVDNTLPLPLSTSKPNAIKALPGRIRQGLHKINPVYAAVGAGMIPATLAAVMPIMLGKRKRRDVAARWHSPSQLPRNSAFLLSHRF